MQRRCRVCRCASAMRSEDCATMGGSWREPGRVTVPGREGDELQEGTWRSIQRQRAQFSAYVPDLPGCVSTGSTSEETQRNIREAIKLHLAGLRGDGLPLPSPSAVGFADVA